MMSVRSSFYFCAIVMLAAFCSFTYAQELNTYQTIKTHKPNLFKLSVSYGDQVKINVFDTNAQFQIQFLMEQLTLRHQQICFADQECSMIFESQWDTDGVVVIMVLAYQYSYEIILNGVSIKREDLLVTNFINGLFVYNKHIYPGTYTLRVFYQSAYTPSLTMTFLNQNFTIMANYSNQVKVEIIEQNPFYQFYFSEISDQEQSLNEIIDHFFSVTIQLPNQLLKGCDGTNIYDPQIRACPITDFKTQDTLKINKIGTYPTFQLKEEQKVQIKITITEFKKWPEFFYEQMLTLFIGNGTNPSAFYGLTKQEIASKFKLKQQCSMSNPSCTFVFKLSKGSYIIMPLFLQSEQNAFVYLYERFNGDKLVESFYSVLPTILEDKKFYQGSMLLEFTNHKEILTVLEITCKNPFIVIQTNIVEKTKSPQSDGAMQLKLVEYSADNVMNHNLNKAQIFTSLQANKTYLLIFTFMSLQKIEQEQKRQERQNLIDPNIDDEMEEPDQIEQSEQDEVGFFYLQAQLIEIKINNGKFPHRKLSSKQQLQEKSISNNESHEEQTEKQKQTEKPKQTEQAEQTQKESKDTQDDESSTKPVDSKQQSDNQSHLTLQEQKQPQSSPKSTSILIQVLGAVLVILILLVAFYLCLFNRTPINQNDHKQLVTEQASGSITMPDSSMELSQVIKTQQSVSRSQTTEIQESPKPQQKLYELKEIEQESMN